MLFLQCHNTPTSSIQRNRVSTLHNSPLSKLIYDRDYISFDNCGNRNEWVEVEIPLFIQDDDELHAQYAYVHTLNSTGQIP